MPGSRLRVSGISFVFCLIAAGLVTSPAAFAAGDASLSLSPSSGTYGIGSTIMVTVSETSAKSDKANAAEADLIYDQTLLQYESSNLGVFPLCTQNKGGDGKVAVACASTTPKEGKQTVAIITFKVLAAGVAQVNMVQGSTIYNVNGKSVWDGKLPRAAYTLSTTAPNGNDSPESSSQPTGTSLKTKASEAAKGSGQKAEDATGTIDSQSKPASSTMPLLGIGGVVVVLAAAGTAWWYFGRKKQI